MIAVESWRVSGVNDHAGIAVGAARECNRGVFSFARNSSGVNLDVSAQTVSPIRCSGDRRILGPYAKQ